MERQGEEKAAEKARKGERRSQRNGRWRAEDCMGPKVEKAAGEVGVVGGKEAVEEAEGEEMWVDWGRVRRRGRRVTG